MAKKILLVSVVVWIYTIGVFAQPHRFALSDSVFLLDGKPFQIISGEMHYPRVPREAWRQRMRMAKAMGLNTIGTYVFWNLHEPQKGKFDFTGNNDVAAFVRTAKEEGLWVVLRPSPYVCAEWEFGGYPYWLENEPGLVVRSREAAYLAEYKKYITEIGRQLAPLQVTRGGNILMVQVENEYGSYGKDKTYLAINRRMFENAGFDCLLTTCDPASAVKDGHLEGLLPGVNGIDDPDKVKEIVRANNQGKGPFLVAEWYPAWFDWWGAPHHQVPAEKYASRLDKALAAGISINMYMFHGGTTRGFMNGANCNDRDPFEPQISSYDYDAPLNEAGNATPKFMAFRNVIRKHLPKETVLPDVPPSRPVIAIPAIRLSRSETVFSRLPKAVNAAAPLSFEDLRQPYGFVLYRTTIPANESGVLKVNGLRDFGIVFIDGVRTGVMDRRIKSDSLVIGSSPSARRLDILVENLGRINYGPYLLQNKKGIIGHVSLGGKQLRQWQMFPLPFDTHGNLPQKESAALTGQPVVRAGSFSLNAVGDTYLDMRNWGKGVVWVNGHNLGRYWNAGPQQTVYVPAEWLKRGKNEVFILELLKPANSSLSALDHPVLDQLQAPQ
ncbi:glycoside hydrolase family 35 protein [Sediminibacterium soli]|uniref:glycoside hydrolase family 35 protein n=1 Tax=Sediminibacterium soli TaxID=2698829 RepID=UPI00137954BA|nr:beta-galactosidase family protein [Sediminibacterium soli]NCI47709.1 beta-galactosidase [Sediminibacterium soli]